MGLARTKVTEVMKALLCDLRGIFLACFAG
jgi:hypothetical protein